MAVLLITTVLVGISQLEFLVGWYIGIEYLHVKEWPSQLFTPEPMCPNYKVERGFIISGGWNMV